MHNYFILQRTSVFLTEFHKIQCYDTIFKLYDRVKFFHKLLKAKSQEYTRVSTELMHN